MCAHVCASVCARVCAGVCLRLTYREVYGSTGDFLQSCLPAAGVSANLFLFFLKGDIKTRH